MNNQITDPPLDHDSGLDFNYWQWTANTDITLTNVPWNNDYRDVVWFDTSAKLNQYIDSHDAENTTISNSMYAAVDRPIQLDIPYNIASRFNYVRVFNRGQSFSGADIPRYLYYFITNTSYISTHNTEFTVQLDVFQTFSRQVKFGRCYIERGHIGIANTENFRNFGRDFLTIPEGLDVGSEYMNIAHKSVQIMNTSPTGYDVLVVSTTQLEVDAGTKDDPQLVSAQGSRFMGIPSGASFYVFPGPAAFGSFMFSMMRKPWVTQGIISITAIPRLSRYYPELIRPTNKIGALSTDFNAPPRPVTHQLWRDWRYDNKILDYIPPRYRHLRKFFTSPYMMIEATTWSGTPIMLKPEAWNSFNATIKEFASLIPPETRVVFSPMSYNSRTRPLGPTDPNLQFRNSYSDDNGEYLDLSTQITNFPRLSMVNNGALGYLAANARGIAYGASSADWSQQRALRGNQVGYDQASTNLAAARNQMVTSTGADAASTAIGNQLVFDQSVLGGVGKIGAGIIGGAATKGLAGAAAGLLGGAAGTAMNMMGNQLQTNANNAQLANRMSSAVEMSNIQQGAGSYMRDTNKGLADWAAKGDYENAIAGINAKTQDAQLIQPSTSGQMGGEYLNLLSGNVGLNVRWKMIDQAAISVIGEYWLRYGYAVRRSSQLPPNLMTMTHFTYWKLLETYIVEAAIPEGFKQAFRGIMEKGVTVWAKPEYIGAIDPAINKPLPNITLEGYEPPELEIEPPIEPPTETKRKRKRMLVFRTTDGAGNLWALAGTSPGNTANWLETRDSTLALKFVQACGVDDAVTIAEAQFDLYRSQYIAPLIVDNVGAEPEPDPETPAV